MFVLIIVLLSPVAVTAASWTQQYGDCSSTSYVPFNGSIDMGWRYLGQRASLDMSHPHSPSVSVSTGNIYISLQSRVLAVSPQGMVLREYDVQQKDAEYYLETSNVVYSEKHQSVIVIGSGSTSDHEQGQELARLSALDPSSGKVLWYQDDNNKFQFLTSHWLALSEKQGLVYVISIDGISALDIKTGSVAWKQQMALSEMWPVLTRVSDELDIILLPVVPGTDDGTLYALSTSTGKVIWKQSLGFNYDGSFVISSTGIIYGCTGLFSDISHGKELLILDAKNGNVLYSGSGYCSTQDYQVKTPSVDKNGNGYYSCGNQVFSVTPNGKLRWASAKYGEESLPPHIPISVHPDGTLYYVTINQTTILALSPTDGTVIKSYTGTSDVMINQPPLLMGDQYMYIVGLAQESTAYIYPMER